MQNSQVTASSITQSDSGSRSRHTDHSIQLDLHSQRSSRSDERNNAQREQRWLRSFWNRIWKWRYVYWVVSLTLSAMLFGFFIRFSIQAQQDRRKAGEKWKKVDSGCRVVNSTIVNCSTIEKEDKKQVIVIVDNYSKKRPKQMATVGLECTTEEEAKEEKEKKYKKGTKVTCYLPPLDIPNTVAFDEGPNEELEAGRTRNAIIMIVLTVLTFLFVLVALFGALYTTIRSDNARSFILPINRIDSGRIAGAVVNIFDSYRGGELSDRARLGREEVASLIRRCRMDEEGLRSIGSDGEHVCPVCLDDIVRTRDQPTTSSDAGTSSDHDTVIRLPCSHMFHGAGCLLTWLSECTGKCPVCGFSIVNFIRNSTENGTPGTRNEPDPRNESDTGSLETPGRQSHEHGEERGRNVAQASNELQDIVRQ